MVASLIALPATAAPASPGRVEFEVLRNGLPFGKQSVVVSEANGELVAESQADLKADFGPITVFHYQQTCRETWGNSGLADLSCSTNKNGQKTKVEGTREAGSLQVSAGKKQIDFPLGSLPSAWWTKPPVANYDMINTETGQRMPVRVTRIGRETIDTGKGRVEAEHIRVSGTLTVDLWYDDAGHWVSCAFSMSGQKMTYRLLTPIAEGPA
ncbi:MAG: DUF6134 family protein [Alphaproteobacteria bacterium]